jgi:catechol 2,3-dioxygenase-like lactoylglutathione lyase family enzyme
MAAPTQQAESPWMLVLAGGAMLLGTMFLLWTRYELEIVHGGVVLYHYVGFVWNWVPLDLVREYSAMLERRYARAYAAGEDMTFLGWMQLSATACRPLAILMLLPGFFSIALVWFGPRLDLRRRFKGDDLMAELMKTFSGVAPVARLSLINGTDPLWRPQMWPEELVREQRLARDDEVVAERARRFYAKTLGPRVVDLRALQGTDPRAICFADNMSATGKTIYAILCAFAFGGESGRIEARSLLDRLNYTAYATAHGEANLSVASELYQKYRMQTEAHALFRVHHYENTYLFELFNRAKRWGKINTSHFRWLRPMDRYKFLALNTVKRFSPHPESAAVFNLHAFERACYRQGRIPRAPTEAPASDQAAGSAVEAGAPYLEDAVEALRTEYRDWRGRRDVEGDEQIWKRDDLWKISNPAYNPATPAPPPEAAGPDTAFDVQMKEQEADAEKKRTNRLLDELASFN